MQSSRSQLHRRTFLGTLGTAVGGWSLRPVWSQEAQPKTDAAAHGPISFFHIGDTHFLADKNDTKKLDARSATTTGGLVDTLNRLADSEIPEAAGGGRVHAPRGVIHAGDVIDSGDKSGGDYPAMIDTEWASFRDAYGLNGRDGRLKFPVYEVHGNHDSPTGDGVAIKHIAARNKQRPGVTNVSANGLHYSWDWGPVHFVNLGIVVGGDPAIQRKRRYNPLDSLPFLIADLKANVGESRRPVVLTHHIDMVRYATGCDTTTAPVGKEWDPCDVSSYYAALKSYNVVAILYGHTHTRNVYRWDGSTNRGQQGIPTFNVDNSSHFSGEAQAFFYFEIGARELVVREYATNDRWQTGSWTPQVWRVPIA